MIHAQKYITFEDKQRNTCVTNLYNIVIII